MDGFSLPAAGIAGTEGLTLPLRWALLCARSAAGGWFKLVFIEGWDGS
jgi:hypothetical protein